MALGWNLWTLNLVVRDEQVLRHVSWSDCIYEMFAALGDVSVEAVKTYLWAEGTAEPIRTTDTSSLKARLHPSQAVDNSLLLLADRWWFPPTASYFASSQFTEHDRTFDPCRQDHHAVSKLEARITLWPGVVSKVTSTVPPRKKTKNQNSIRSVWTSHLTYLLKKYRLLKNTSAKISQLNQRVTNTQFSKFHCRPINPPPRYHHFRFSNQIKSVSASSVSVSFKYVAKNAICDPLPPLCSFLHPQPTTVLLGPLKVGYQNRAGLRKGRKTRTLWSECLPIRGSSPH